MASTFSTALRYHTLTLKIRLAGDSHLITLDPLGKPVDVERDPEGVLDPVGVGPERGGLIVVDWELIRIERTLETLADIDPGAVVSMDRLPGYDFLDRRCAELAVIERVEHGQRAEGAMVRPWRAAAFRPDILLKVGRRLAKVVKRTDIRPEPFGAPAARVPSAMPWVTVAICDRKSARCSSSSSSGGRANRCRRG